MSLWENFLTNDGRMIHKWTHYFPVYERHFGRFRDRPFTLIEIGCGAGGSLAMWKRFFGPFVQIVGLDIRPECKSFEEHQIQIRIGDQSDTHFLQSVIDEFGSPAIVIDDGSHIQQHVSATFDFLYPKTQPDGIYVVEDLHTAYWPDHGGGLNEPASFIERCKRLIDELNGVWTPDRQLVTPFTKQTMSMAFYDSMVVFERGRMPEPIAFESSPDDVKQGFAGR